MGIKFEFTLSEKATLETALELLVESYHEDNCAFPAHDARGLLKLVRSRGPQTAPSNPQTAPTCYLCNDPAVSGPYAEDYCTADGCIRRGPDASLSLRPETI